MSLKQFYIESYGCQMNVNDSEIVAAILCDHGYVMNRNFENADLILLNTCSVREKAEQTVRKRLQTFSALKKRNKGLLIGILGCMAERLKQSLLEEEKMVDLVVGPDAYRSLPALVASCEQGQKSVNVLLSREETYAEISPVRLDANGVSAFVTIMRGCDNMCTFCIVPFTRGRERSRSVASIVRECENLFDDGYRDITLLGQNVDSYLYQDEKSATNFAQLLDTIARISPNLRVRFSTSHPKDITDEVLHTMLRHDNICKYIHLPVQSGSDSVLARMKRGYTHDWYMEKFARIKQLIPHCVISTDIITGFCGEREEDHARTLALMEKCRFPMAYMFMYSERPNTPAAKKLIDDVAQEVKNRRLQEIIDLHRRHAAEHLQKEIGATHEVLIEGDAKKDSHSWRARTQHNYMVVFPKKDGDRGVGTYTNVHICAATSATLLGERVSVSV